MEVQHSDGIFVSLKYQCFIEVLVKLGGYNFSTFQRRFSQKF